jgi:uncharacterized protein YndB with AHSA1/START domain
MMFASRLVQGAAVVALAGGTTLRASADVVNVAANGFEVRETVHVAASPDKVYAAMLMPAHWWNSEHTFSGNAANLSLEARAGGCWCESLPGGGSVEHLRVVYLSPGKVLRLRGALGPFQALAVDGVMTWSVKSAADGSDVSFTYSIGGYLKDGADDLSKAADRVLGEQIDRLKKSVEGTAVAGDAPRAH